MLLELAVPVVRARKPAVDDAHDTTAAAARFDRPLGRELRAVRTHIVTVGGEHPRRITSNIALSDWERYLGDVTLTATILDRIAMHAIRIDIDGPSYRQHLAKSRAAEPSAKA